MRLSFIRELRLIVVPICLIHNSVVVSLKPGHKAWVRYFDFMLNLFSFSPFAPSTCTCNGFLTHHSGLILGTVR